MVGETPNSGLSGFISVYYDFQDDSVESCRFEGDLRFGAGQGAYHRRSEEPIYRHVGLHEDRLGGRPHHQVRDLAAEGVGLDEVGGHCQVDGAAEAG